MKIRHYACAVTLAAGLCASNFALSASDQPFFGMQIQGLSPTIIETLGLKSASGVLVRDIAYPGPASHSGLRRGDVILSLNGKTAETVENVIAMVQTFKPGDKVKVKVLRRAREYDIEVPIGNLLPTWDVQRNKFATVAPLGISFAALTDKVKERFDLAWRTRGVVVSLVDEEKTKGLDIKVGDVVVQVNQSPVWKPEQIIGFIKKAQVDRKEMILLLVEGTSGFRFVLLPVPHINETAEAPELPPLPNLVPKKN